MSRQTPRDIMICVECETRVVFKWDNRVNKVLTERQMCFTCSFWFGYTKSTRGVRIEGKHYMIGPESGTQAFRGFGGRIFNIQFLDDDKVVTTTNLWFQGEIPEHFRDRLPDNARWVKQ